MTYFTISRRFTHKALTINNGLPRPCLLVFKDSTNARRLLKYVRQCDDKNDLTVIEKHIEPQLHYICRVTGLDLLVFEDAYLHKAYINPNEEVVMYLESKFNEE